MLIDQLQSLEAAVVVEQYNKLDYPPEYDYKSGPQTKRPPAVDEEERKRRKNEVDVVATRRGELRAKHDRRTSAKHHFYGRT